ncbi:ABC transporter transmembrane domain-containing protein [Aliiroseovarius sp. YM-037]|uniref:ABC transporter transmembrane domain-containing protein n=1 Tax=Aliiroseovarius sp. YM-037 TaxID=3341728 RepID=UPI003A812477
MESSITAYIWKHTKKQQLWILLVVALSMIPYFMSFDLPKQIVNGPIQGEGFSTADATRTFFRIEFDVYYFGHVVLFEGVELARVGSLFLLSGMFLALVIINGLFKLYINTYKGKLGERLLRRIRFELIDKVLRFPPKIFKRVKSAEIAGMVKDEVEPIGGFSGDAFVTPALLGGQALTALVFIFVQSIPLGLITLTLVAVQAIIIPKMRRRLLVLGRERQLTARQMAGRVSEIVDGIDVVHSYDTSNYERADVVARLGRIFKIRYDIYQWKFMVKFLNNLLASFTPFFFYIVGGYLAIQGRIDIGQLVAVIAAYKDLPGPLKELIDWDQARQDVQIKYTQVIGQFTIDGLIDPSIQAVVDGDAAQPLNRPLAAVNLSLADDSGAKILERTNLQITPGETIGILGTGASGGDALAEALGRLQWPETGKVVAGSDDILTLPESVTGRSISYASSDAYFFSGSLRDNLLYGLKHAPVSKAVYEDGGVFRKWEEAEARRAGNPVFDISDDWINYAAVGANGQADLLEFIIPILDKVLFSKDILDLALRSTADLSQHPDLPPSILKMRHALRERLEAENQTGLIDFFEPGVYNTESTVGENLLFGNAVGTALMPREIGKNAYFRTVIENAGLDRVLYKMGYEIAETAIELFGDLQEDHPFFQQLTFMSADDIPEYQRLVQKLDGVDFADVPEEDRPSIIRLSFAYIEPRHRFGLLTDELMAQIVEARQAFHAGLPEDLKDDIEIYDPTAYTVTGSLMDNVVFGRLNSKHADGAERIQAMVLDLLNEQGLYNEFLSCGLDFQVGTGGKRLTLAQRQKLTLARALLRPSAYFIFNRPLTALDNASRNQIARNVLALKKNTDNSPAIVWVLADTTLATLFDRIIVFDGSTLVEDGTYAELIEKDGLLKELVSR